MEEDSKYRNNISRIKEEINLACIRSGRMPSDVKILAASKYANPGQIEKVMNLGIENFGENRAEELLEKFSFLGNQVKWHFIGHLQSRKVKLVVPVAEYIHSVDTVSILEKINRQAFSIGKLQKVLIEVNISGEKSKYGIMPDELEELLKISFSFENIETCGLMTICPLTSDSDLIRKIFSNLRNIFKTIKQKYKILAFEELSMGMSNDYKIAVEEGSTMLRIGSSIFL